MTRTPTPATRPEAGLSPPRPTSTPDDDLTVVVVGAGPAGLAAAITLSRAGIECLIVDRRSEPSPLPRATGVSMPTMELLRGWGLEDDVRAGGNDVEWQMLVCPTLSEAGAARRSTSAIRRGPRARS